MKDFDSLRRLAREKRDKAIKIARDEYAVTLEEINTLQKRLTRKPSQKGRPKPAVPLRDKIMAVVPRDRMWTVPELLQWLKRPATDKAIVLSTLDRLRRRGDIKRIRRGTRNRAALFAVAEFQSDASELNGLSQIGAAEVVLREIGPADIMTLVIAMLDRGYVPAKDPQTLKKSLRRYMGRSTRFCLEGALWSVPHHLLLALALPPKRKQLAK